jgi:hypothetical protein
MVDGWATAAERAALYALAICLPLVEGPAQIAGVVLLVLLVSRSRFPRWRDAFRTSVPILGFGVWMLAGYLPWISGQAGHGTVSSEALTRPLWVLMAWVGAGSVAQQPAPVLRRMGLCFVGAAAVAGVYGVIQVGWNAGLLESLLLKNPDSTQIQVIGAPERRLASGTFYNRLKFAHMEMMACGLIVLLMLHAYRLGCRRWLLGLAIGAGLCVAAPVLANTRADLGAAAAAGFVCALLMIRRLRFRHVAWMSGALISVVGVSLLFSPLEEGRWVRLSDSVSTRGKIWSVAWEIGTKHPWLGTGHGRFSSAAAEATTWTSSAFHIDAHQFWLHTLVETGLVGFLGFWGAWSVGLVRVMRSVRDPHRDQSPAHALLYRWVCYVLVFVMGLGLFHYPLHHAPIGLLTWLCVGAAYRASVAARPFGVTHPSEVPNGNHR